MKVLIDISQEMFKATQTYYSDNTTRLSIKSCIEKIANGTPIPEGATNGDMVKAMFPNLKGKEKAFAIHLYVNKDKVGEISMDWWNQPYKGVN